MNKRNFIESKNFFADPDLVREFALNQQYRNWVWGGNGIWSGFRSPLQDESITNELVSKLEILNQRKIKTIQPCFHINPRVSMHGFPHTDFEAHEIDSFAGVVYLNKEFPQERCGTTIYEDLPEHKRQCEEYILNFYDKMEIVYDTTISPNNKFKHQFSKECLNFKTYVLKTVKCVDFEYNKVLCYPGYVLHSPDFYFGDIKETSRLTIAFHGQFHAV